MAIPDYETLMMPLLRIAEANKGNDVALIDAIGQLTTEFKLTEEEKRKLLPSGTTFKFSSRVSWARTYLQKAGLLESTHRSHFKVTQRGIEVLNKKPTRIDNKLLQQFEEFKEFQGKKKTKKENNSTLHGWCQPLILDNQYMVIFPSFLLVNCQGLTPLVNSAFKNIE